MRSVAAVVPIDHTDADAGADDTGTPVECADLDPTTCTAEPECVPISGMGLSSDGAGGTCLDLESGDTVSACISSDLGCGEAITFARPPGTSSDLDCMMFTTTCTPDDWIDCGYLDDSECPEASCEGTFAGTGPGCCDSPDESTTSAMSPASCDDGEWACDGEDESICSCAGTSAAYDCVSSCEDGADVMLPFCVYGDHWECPVDMVRSDSCGDSVE